MSWPRCVTGITIPKSVTTIGEGAFQGCFSLESVTIGNGVKSIGEDTFADCANLASVSIMGNPKIGNGAIPNGATVTLSLTAYDADGAKWMTFYNDLLGTMETKATPANAYTLASGSYGLGFYHYTGSEVAAGKAYLVYGGASSAREFFGFEDETTEIVNTNCTNRTNEGDGQIYDLQGRKVQQPVRGIYVRDGQKVVIK